MADHWWWRPGWRPGRRVYPLTSLIGPAQFWPHISAACSSAMLPAAPYEAALAGHTASAETIPLRGI